MKLLVKIFSGAILGMTSLVNAAGLDCDASNKSIITVPMYMEDGILLNGNQEAGDYRRVLRFLSSRIVNLTGTSVKSPVDLGARTPQDRRFWEGVYEEVRQSGGNMTDVHKALPRTMYTNIAQEYGMDMVYVFSLRSSQEITYNQFCSVSVVIEGEAYDPAGNALGIATYKKLSRASIDCQGSKEELQVELGQAIGSGLSEWICQKNGQDNTDVTDVRADTSSVMPNHNQIDVRISGLTDYMQVSILTRLLRATRGVESVKVMGSAIDSQNIKNSYVNFQVKTDGIQSHNLASLMVRVKNKAIRAEDIGNEDTGLFRFSDYTLPQLHFLHGLTVSKSYSNLLEYVVDGEKIEKFMRLGK